MKNQHNYFPEEKRFNNRISSLLIIIAFLMTSMVTYAVPAKAKFTGEWTLNSAKSSIAEYGEMISSRELKIDQKRKNLSIERTGISQTGENYLYTEEYTLDGETCENTIFETAIKKSTVEWSEDNQKLTITSTILIELDGQKMEIGLIEILEFTEDKNSLSFKQNASSEYGDISNSLFYDKE